MKNINLRKYIRKALLESFGDDVLSGIDFKNSHNDLTDDEVERFVESIIKQYWKPTPENSHRRELHYRMYEYWLPMEAKSALDSVGYKYYEVERASNKDHPDYGKMFVTINWTDVNK